MAILIAVLTVVPAMIRRARWYGVVGFSLFIITVFAPLVWVCVRTIQLFRHLSLTHLDENQALPPHDAVRRTRTQMGRVFGGKLMHVVVLHLSGAKAATNLYCLLFC